MKKLSVMLLLAAFSYACSEKPVTPDLTSGPAKENPVDTGKKAQGTGIDFLVYKGDILEVGGSTPGGDPPLDNSLAETFMEVLRQEGTSLVINPTDPKVLIITDSSEEAEDLLHTLWEKGRGGSLPDGQGDCTATGRLALHERAGFSSDEIYFIDPFADYCYDHSYTFSELSYFDDKASSFSVVNHSAEAAMEFVLYKASGLEGGSFSGIVPAGEENGIGIDFSYWFLSEWNDNISSLKAEWR